MNNKKIKNEHAGDNVTTTTSTKHQGWLDRIEAMGNKLPDPALLFFILLLMVWICSAIFAQLTYALSLIHI